MCNTGVSPLQKEFRIKILVLEVDLGHESYKGFP